MPEYAYVCLDCGKKFSARMTISEHDKQGAKCPKCGSKKLRQEVTGFYAITSKKS